MKVIGDGANHTTLVHVDDVAELYAPALSAPAGAVYNAVVQSLPMRAVAEALSRALAIPGQLRSVHAEEFGPIGEAFALEQQVDSRRAMTQLGWKPAHHDALADLAVGV